jgi:hypothetical protein
MAPAGPSMTQSKDPELQKESLNIVDEELTTVMLNDTENFRDTEIVALIQISMRQVLSRLVNGRVS